LTSEIAYSLIVRLLTDGFLRVLDEKTTEPIDNM